MGILKNAWKPAGIIGVAAMSLSACDIQPLTGETPYEAERRVTTTTAAVGAIACGLIQDYRQQRTCFAAAALGASAAGANARNTAATQGYCTDTRSGRKGANNPVYENCTRRSPW